MFRYLYRDCIGALGQAWCLFVYAFFFDFRRVCACVCFFVVPGSVLENSRTLGWLWKRKEQFCERWAVVILFPLGGTTTLRLVLTNKRAVEF